MVNKDLQH